MRTRLHTLVLGLLLTGAGHAQQSPMYGLYMWNMMTVMPGYAGSAGVLNATAVSRVQWAAINGAPITHALSAHAPIKFHNLGWGGSLVHDRIGRTYTTAFYTDVAYRIKVTRHTQLAFGLKVGLDHVSARHTQVEHTDPNDPTFSADVSSRVRPNFGAGLYLWSRKGYLGLSAPKLLRNHQGRSELDGVIMDMNQETPHYFVTAGYVLPVGSVKVRPSILVRATEGAPLSMDVAAHVFMMERLSLGAGYRHGDGIQGMFSVQMTDQLRMGYAYTVGTSPLARRSNGSHEIMFSYDPVFTRERVRSPRYF